MALITGDELARDLPGAEFQLTRHKERKAEIDSRKDQFQKFQQTGQALINSGHFLSGEVGTLHL